MHKDEEATSEQDSTKDCHSVTEAEIDSTLKDSFPASDPPSWTLGTAPCDDTSEDPEEQGDEAAVATNQEQDAASSMKNKK